MIYYRCSSNTIFIQNIMTERKTDTLSRKQFLKVSAASFIGLTLPEYLRQVVPYVSHGDRHSNKIALTIDDGWNPELVESAMEILDKKPASFFIVGKCINKDPKIYEDAVKKGFELHNHTWSHQYLNDSNVNMSEEIVKWEDAYTSLGFGAYKNKVLRPPANEGVNDPKLYSTLGKLGYKAVLGWSYGSPGVYKNYTKEDVINFILPRLEGGDIILMHFTQTDMDALPEIIKQINSRGFELVGLSRMPGIPIYTEPAKSMYKPHDPS